MLVTNGAIKVMWHKMAHFRFLFWGAILIAFKVNLSPASRLHQRGEWNHFASATQLPARACDVEQLDQGLKADCSKRGLISVPTYLTDEVIYLDLNHNNITVLGNSSFDHLPRLVYLTVANNDVRIIEKRAFHPLSMLEKVVLKDNQLAYLAGGVFSQNQHLTVVDLSDNLMSTFPGESLNSLKMLKAVTVARNNISSPNVSGLQSVHMSSISFASNAIASIQENDFLGLQINRIDTMYFDNNKKLQSLPDFVFRYLEEVGHMHLTNNIISNFSLYPFLGMRSLELLGMDNTKISLITPLGNFTNSSQMVPPLKDLSLRESSLKSIPPGSFKGLDKLIYLNLYGSGLKYLYNDSFAGLFSLERLFLNSNAIPYVNSAMFTILPNLKTLDLSRTGIGGIMSPKLFSGMRSLNYLKLSSCKIRTLPTIGWDLPSLETLILKDNKIDEIKSNSFKGLTHLKNLTLSQNPIESIQDRAFATNDNLTVLELSSLSSKRLGGINTPFINLSRLTSLDFGNSKVSLIAKSLSGLSALKQLSLRNSDITSLCVADQSILSCVPSLERLYLSNNPRLELHPGTFKALNQLKVLKMDDCGLDALPIGIFHGLVSLNYLHLDNNNIKKLSPGHFSDVPNLLSLSARNNYISEIQANLFKNLSVFSVLYLSENSLTSIHPKTIFPRATMDLSNNPLACTCELEWFRNWLDWSNVSTHHLDKTICSNVSLNSLRNKPVLYFNPEKDCGPMVWLVVVIVNICLVVVLGSTVTYRRRWLIRYKLYRMRLAVFGRGDVADDRDRLIDYEYDINIMFHDDDDKWVRETLRKGIIERLPDLGRIVCGDHDLPLGMYYIEALIEVTERSYKNILVASRAAVGDHVFNNKLRIAVDHMNESEVENVILIFKEDIPHDALPDLARVFLSKNQPAFSWNEDPNGQRLLWDNLVNSLGTNTRLNHRLP